MRTRQRPRRGARTAGQSRAQHRSDAPDAAADRAGNDAGTGAISLRPALIELTCAATARVLELAYPADSVVRRFFHEHARLGRRERAFIAETVFALLRRRQYLEHLCGRDLRRTVLAAARMFSGADTAALAVAAGHDDAAWIATLPDRPQDDDLAFAIRAELPDWVIEHMRARMSDEEILRIGRALQVSAPLDLRVNTLRTTRARALEQLVAEGFACGPTPWSPLGIRLAGKPALERHPLFLDGTLEVQDEGSQILALLVGARRREMVVDFCAGAGGKTLALGAMMRSEGRLYAFDVAERRLARMRTRLARSGLSNVHPQVIASERDARARRLAGKIDRVLVDAPCTGLGTLRRNPDLKWRQSPATLAALRERQRAILGAAARLLKPGGRLVYATCSFLHDENEAVVEAFLEADARFELLDCAQLLRGLDIAIDTGRMLRLAPHLHGTDGFFAAVLERTA